METTSTTSHHADGPRVVIVGGGFGGLRAARALRHAPVRITLIDRRNHHLFQPLLYQVATAALSPGDISAPIRHVLHGQENADILLAEVTGVDVVRREVEIHDLAGDNDRAVPYDYLVLATGADQSYFGHDEWAAFAPGLKSIEDATGIRRKVLLAFETAEDVIEHDPQSAQEYLTFVVVGAGPTGIEMAGELAEVARKALVRDFRHINPASARIVLVEAAPHILAAYPESLSRKGTAKLRRLGVEVRTSAPVRQVDAHGVVVDGERIAARTVIWAAGVRASSAAEWIGAEADRAGRVIVTPELTVPGHPEIFVIGDTAHATWRGRQLPALAPVALQQGHYVARAIQTRLRGRSPQPFAYFDKGTLSTVGRLYALADIRGLRVAGFFAWMLWVGVHIFFLVGFRNRFVVMFQWAWAYVTYQRGARLITGDLHRDRVPVRTLR
ncbi:MAG: NAD(P)/FAD-dependent oxidoreductase [Ktedonobacterales bacterium]